MAKKTENFNFDQDDFNFDDYGMGGFNDSSTKRSGARKAVTQFAGGLVSGLKSSFFNASNQRSFISKALPKGYTATFDAVGTTYNAGKSIYEAGSKETKKQLLEASADLKEFSDRHIKGRAPKIGNYVDGLAEEKRRNDEYNAPVDESQQYSADFLAQLSADFERNSKQASMVGIKTSQRATDQIVGATNENLKALIGANRLLLNISNNSDKLMSYKLKVDSLLQRKSIELSYKQYTIQRQMLDVQQQTLDLQKKAFEKLVLNTGLPDAVKITNWEQASRTVKTKLIGAATERATASFAQTGQRLIQQMTNNLTTKIQRAGMSAQTGLMGLNLASSMGGMGPSKSEMAGDMLGGLLMPFLMNAAGKRIGKTLKANKTIKGHSDRMLNFFDTMPNRFNDLQQSSGIFSTIMRTLGVNDILSPNGASQRRVRGSGIDAFDEVTSFNKQTQLAITEVIPGYLRLIQQDLAIMRTGNPNTPDQRYDWNKGTFVTSTKMADDIKGQVYNKTGIKETRKAADQVLHNLDNARQLSPGARKSLTEYILKQGASNNGNIDPRLLMSIHSPIKNQTHAQEIRDVLSNEFNFDFKAPDNDTYNPFNEKDIISGNLIGGNKYQAKMQNANNALKGLRSTMPMARNKTLNHAAVGNMDLLQSLGAITWNEGLKQWDYDEDQYRKVLMGGGIPKMPPSNAAGVGVGQPFGPFGPPPPGPSPTPTPTPGQPDLTYTPFQEELLDTIRDNNANQQVGVTNELLEAIRSRLEAGIPQSGTPADPVDTTRKTSLFRKLLNGTKWTAGKVGGYFKMQGRLAMGTARLATRIVTKPLGALYNAVIGTNQLKRVSDLSKGGMKSLGDLYVKGKDEVVIKLSDLQAGKYFDESTRRVITKFSDIKGAIVDADGNVIISEEDVKNKLYTMVKGRPFSILGGMLRAGLGAVAGLFKLNTAGFMLQARFMKRTAVGAWNLGKKLLGRGSDIYVVGETSPRLLANIMRNGGYFTQAGKVIRSVSDIVGDVLDAQGNVILSVADMSKGLVDKNGKPFKSLTTRILGLLSLPAKMAWGGIKLGTRLATKPFRMLGSLLKWGKGKLGKKLSGKESASEVTLHMASTIDRIYDLLNKRLPKSKRSWNSKNGNGFRDGSREDILSRMKNVFTGRNKDGQPKDKNRGILGMMAMILGGIGTLAGTVKGWMGNMFGLVKGLGKAKAMADAAGILGGLGGAGAGAGKRGLISRIFGGLKSIGRLMVGTKYGRMALGGAALLGLSRTSYGSDVIAGAGNAFSGNANSSVDEANKQAQAMLSDMDGGVSGGGTGGTAGESEAAPEGNKKTFAERLKTAVGGSLIGEVAAIASMPLLFKGVSHLAKKTGLGEVTHPKAPAANASRWAKMGHFLGNTGKGRMVSAALTGAGLYGAKEMMFDQSDNTLGGSALTSYGTTLGIDAAALLAPLAIAKFGPKIKDKIAAMRGQTPAIPAVAGRGVYSPHVGQVGGLMSRPLATNRLSAVPNAVVPPRPNTPNTIPSTTPTPSTPTTRAPGVWGKVKGLGGGVLKHAGLLGVGLAGMDAYNTQGDAWDKTKAFGSTLAQSIVANKVIGAGFKAVTKAGRAELMSGGRSALTRVGGMVGRQALMQGGRTALMAGASMLGGVISAPVLLGAAAVAGLGVAAWLGYKYFFKKDQNAIARFRMAQYGFDLDNADRTTKVGQLEALCQKSITISPDGKAAIGKSVSVDAVVKIFAIPLNDQKRVHDFSQWFESRFKPVFLNAIAAYKGITKSTDLEKADTLDKKQKTDLVNQMMNNVPPKPDPYGLMNSPFGEEPLKYDRSDVESEYKAALRNISHETGKGEQTTGDKITSKLSKSWDAVKNFAGDTWDKTKDVAGRLANGAQGVAGSVGGFLKDSLSNGLSFGKNVPSGNLSGAWGNVTQGVQNVGNLASDLYQNVKTMSGTTREKFTKIRKAAIHAGDPHPDIVAAQWAVESGWGAKESGKFNYFGIKAVGNQPGTMVPTHEVINGRRIKINAKFADYKSLDDGILARVQFIRQNPRYTKAGYFTATTPAQAAQALLRAGYATDPHYAVTLCKIIKGCGFNPDAPSPKPGSKEAAAQMSSPSPTQATTSNGTSQGLAGSPAQGQPAIPKVNLPGVAATSYGGANLKALSSSGSVSVSGDASSFLKSLDPNLIALGKKATRMADASVDINGMVKGFMVCFYAMVGEAVQSGVLTFVQVNSANRSIERQTALYNQYLTKGSPLAAKPGSSNHNFGIAIDINSSHANAMASKGLLDKYHFHRPLLNHPRHPEPWHLENKLFARGAKNTQKEVAKSVADKASPQKVAKATQDTGKDSPIVKAENQAKENKTPIQQSVSPSSTGAMSVPTSTDSASTIKTPSTILSEQNQSVTTQSVKDNADRRANQQLQQDQSVVDVLNQQLKIQTQTLEVLTKLHEHVSGSSAKTEAAPTDQASASQLKGAAAAADALKGKIKDVPVMMSFLKS